MPKEVLHSFNSICTFCAPQSLIASSLPAPSEFACPSPTSKGNRVSDANIFRVWHISLACLWGLSMLRCLPELHSSSAELRSISDMHHAYLSLYTWINTWVLLLWSLWVVQLQAPASVGVIAFKFLLYNEEWNYCIVWFFFCVQLFEAYFLPYFYVKWFILKFNLPVLWRGRFHYLEVEFTCAVGRCCYLFH